MAQGDGDAIHRRRRPLIIPSLSAAAWNTHVVVLTMHGTCRNSYNGTEGTYVSTTLTMLNGTMVHVLRVDLLLVGFLPGAHRIPTSQPCIFETDETLTKHY